MGEATSKQGTKPYFDKTFFNISKKCYLVKTPKNRENSTSYFFHLYISSAFF